MSAIVKIPKLRFIEFNDDWEDGKLGSYGKVINGLTYSPNDISNKGLLVLRSSNIQNNQLAYEDTVYVNLEVSEESLTQENDILICVRNGSKRLIGKSAIIPKSLQKATHGAFMTVFRGNNNQFLSHWFQSTIFYKQVHKNLGATINSINGSDLKKFKTIFPKNQEQEKIASFLASVDTKVEQLTKKEQLLVEYKKGVIQKIFSQEIRFKDDDSGAYPDWKNTKFKEITYKISVKNKDNTLYPIYSINNKIGFVPQGEQFDGLDSHSRNYDISLYKIVKEETFAYNPSRINVGSIGYSGELNNIIISSLYICFKTIDSVDDSFISQYLKSFQFNKDVLRNVEGGVREYLFYENFAGIKINLPSKKEQKKIASFLDSIDTNRPSK